MFAMINFPQPFGVNGLPIATSGSLLVACTNLLERFKISIDPVTLNSYLEQTDNIRDYSWSIPHNYDGTIQQTGSGTDNVPDSTDALVCFTYNGQEHYCLVDSITGSQVNILDSLDGTIKSPNQYLPVYGQYTAWRSYTAVIPALPTPPPVAPMIYIENTVDGIYYKSYGNPRKFYVSNRSGTQLIDFSGVVQTYRDFIGVPDTSKSFGSEVRIMGTAHHPVIPSGKDFYISLDDWGEFTRTGHVARLQGYTTNDLQDTPPDLYKPLKPAPVMASIADVTSRPDVTGTTTQVSPAPPDVTIMKLTPEKMGFVWFNDEHTPVRYQVMQRVIVRDYMRRGVSAELTKGKTVAAYGTFPANGQIRLLLKVSDSPMFDYWYGAPEVDRDGNRVLEEVTQTISDTGATTIDERQAMHQLSFRDHANLTFAILERRFNKMKKRNKK